jgi:hypothetical protein
MSFSRLDPCSARRRSRYLKPAPLEPSWPARNMIDRRSPVAGTSARGHRGGHATRKGGMPGTPDPHNHAKRAYRRGALCARLESNSPANHRFLAYEGAPRCARPARTRTRLRNNWPIRTFARQPADDRAILLNPKLKWRAMHLERPTERPESLLTNPETTRGVWVVLHRG